MSRYNRNSYRYADPETPLEPDIFEPEPIPDEVEEVSEVVEEASVAEPEFDKVTAAMKLIAGEFGSDESDIRSVFKDLNLDYDEVTSVKKQILEGTYYK